MKDIQNEPDYRRINIRKVGVKNVSYPITVLDRDKEQQQTIARVNMYVNLPHQFKGTHMSRFVELLNGFHGNFNLQSFNEVLEEMKEKLQAEAAHMEMDFPYFLKKKRTDGKGKTTEYQCSMHGSLEETEDLIVKINIPIAPPVPVQTSSGLPESLGLWGMATVSLRFRHFIWMEDIIELAEEVTSHNLQWSSLAVKPQENTLSVESIAKSLGGKLTAQTDISWFTVTVKNFARGFSTFATLEGPEQ